MHLPKRVLMQMLATSVCYSIIVRTALFKWKLN